MCMQKNEYVTKDYLDKKLDESENRVKTELRKEIKDSHDDVMEVINIFMNQVDKKFEAVDKKFEAIDTKLDRIINAVDGIAGKALDQDQEMTAMKYQLNRHEKWC